MLGTVTYMTGIDFFESHNNPKRQALILPPFERDKIEAQRDK